MSKLDLAYAVGATNTAARSLTGKFGFSPSDGEDIAHELLIAILERWPTFDPNRASGKTFVARILKHKAISLIRRHRAAKRGVGTCPPLQSCTNGNSYDFDEDLARSRRGLRPWTIIESLCLRRDTADVLTDLPPNLRCLCRQLMGASVSAAARSSQTKRTTLYRAIRDLRRRLQDAGLHEYR